MKYQTRINRRTPDCYDEFINISESLFYKYLNDNNIIDNEIRFDSKCYFKPGQKQCVAFIRLTTVTKTENEYFIKRELVK